MSSTSFSSEYEFEEYFHYVPNYNTFRTPYYSNIGHPLIYCAQTEPQKCANKHRQREPKKKSKNCFKKAFRWYTQEMVPSKKTETRNNFMDVPEFVTWLENKYEEFLNEKQLTNNNKQMNYCGSTKMKPRLRSPWKRRRSFNSKEGGDSSVCKNNSFECIMKPMDLSRPPSECWVASSCYETNSIITSDGTFIKKIVINSKSYTNIIEYENHAPVDVVPIQGVGLNEIGVLKEKEEVLLSKNEDLKNVNVIQVPRKASLEFMGATPKKEKLLNASTQYSDIKEDIASLRANSFQITPKQVVKPTYEYCTMTQRVSCQCFDELPDVSIQCECKPVKGQNRLLSVVQTSPNKAAQSENKSNQCLNEIPKVPSPCESRPDNGQINNKTSPIKAQPEIEHLTKQNVSNQRLGEIPKGPSPCGCRPDTGQINNKLQVQGLSYGPRSPRRISRLQETIRTSNVSSTANPIRYFTTFVDDVAQTSDHSICIENNGLPEYPLFMKIICPDKLNEEY